MTSNLTAEQHKLKGNDYFKTKAYDDAIQEYSTAIVCGKASLSLSLSLSPSRRCTILPPIYTLTALSPLFVGQGSQNSRLLLQSCQLLSQGKARWTDYKALAVLEALWAQSFSLWISTD